MGKITVETCDIEGFKIITPTVIMSDKDTKWGTIEELAGETENE